MKEPEDTIRIFWFFFLIFADHSHVFAANAVKVCAALVAPSRPKIRCRLAPSRFGSKAAQIHADIVPARGQASGAAMGIKTHQLDVVTLKFGM